MQMGFKYKYCNGFGRMYNYGLKHFNPNTMITKEAETRLKILNYWKKYGLKATRDAFGAKRSTLYGWWKVYKESGYKIESLNPRSTARKNLNKRTIHPLILKEIKRLRLEECPNMGKEKRIYHHRQKVYHNGQIKRLKKEKKQRLSKEFKAKIPGGLIEVDTVVRFDWNIKRYIITAVDVHSRYAFAFCYDRALSINAKDFIKKLQKIFPYKIKAIQTDNGSEFHKYFKEYLKENNIIHYWNYPGKPFRQGHIEKFNRTIQEEFVDWNYILLEDTNRFNEKMGNWINWYNTKRFHWGLNLETPVDYLINNGYVVQYVVN